ncbi:hypothetical protein, partial [Klebsiella pneumoniae]|uniref:hypothetical protein n=1 Tax=Klebsiella pneumoniae TaxID=573 RepID=UPI001C52E8AA
CSAFSADSPREKSVLTISAFMCFYLLFFLNFVVGEADELPVYRNRNSFGCLVAVRPVSA